MPRRSSARVRMPRPPPTSSTGSPGAVPTSAASASATNGWVRNDCPLDLVGVSSRPSSAEATSAAFPGTCVGPRRVLPRSGGDEEPVLVLGTLELLDDPGHDELLGMLHVGPFLQRREALERTAAAFLYDRPHRLLSDPGEEFQEVESPRDRLGLVEELEEPARVRPDDLLERDRQFALRLGRQLAERQSATNVVDG